jgi:hypothetical protein
LRYGINNDELLKTIWEHKRKKQKKREGERGDFGTLPFEQKHYIHNFNKQDNKKTLMFSSNISPKYHLGLI